MVPRGGGTSRAEKRGRGGAAGRLADDGQWVGSAAGESYHGL